MENKFKIKTLKAKATRCMDIQSLMELYCTLSITQSIQVAAYVYASACEKMFSTELSSTHNYIPTVEEDMFKSIIAGDSFEEFMQENGDYYIREFA